MARNVIWADCAMRCCACSYSSADSVAMRMRLAYWPQLSAASITCIAEKPARAALRTRLIVAAEAAACLSVLASSLFRPSTLGIAARAAPPIPTISPLTRRDDPITRIPAASIAASACSRSLAFCSADLVSIVIDSLLSCVIFLTHKKSPPK